MRAEIILQGPYILVIPETDLDENQVRGIMKGFEERKLLILPAGHIESFFSEPVNIDDL